MHEQDQPAPSYEVKAVVCSSYKPADEHNINLFNSTVMSAVSMVVRRACAERAVKSVDICSKKRSASFVTASRASRETFSRAYDVKGLHELR